MFKACVIINHAQVKLSVNRIDKSRLSVVIMSSTKSTTLLQDLMKTTINDKMLRLEIVNKALNQLYKQQVIIEKNLHMHNTVIQELVFEVINNWIILEKYFDQETKCSTSNRNPKLSSGSNILLTGIKGVGKSTIMMGLHILIKTYGHHVKSVYIDYSTSQSGSPKFPSVLMKNYSPTVFDLITYNRWAISNRTAYLVFGDEVDYLHDGAYDCSSTARVTNIDIMKEFLVIGKSSNAMGVISGSSAKTRSLLYKQDSYDNRHLDFPT